MGVLRAGLAWVIASGILLSLPPAAAWAQEEKPVPQQINRPEAAGRIVRTFDFEPGDREVFLVPRFWELAQDGSPSAGPRPGYPRYNKAELDFSTAYEGKGSVRLSSEGGSACLRLESGVIPVFAITDYLVSAKVRTKGLRQARAAVKVRFLDSASRPIAGSERSSDLITSEETWTTVTVPLPPDIPSAAFLQIDLELLQPQQFAQNHAAGNDGLGKHQVWSQDFPAIAWFDNVGVVQLPRVRLRTPSPANLITSAEDLLISVLVRDLSGDLMKATLLVQDAAGKIVDIQERTIDSGQSDWQWRPRITRFGWYRATLELNTGNARVGSTWLDFAWLPPRPRQQELTLLGDYACFGIILGETPHSQVEALTQSLEQVGSRSVAIPVWSRTLGVDSLEAQVSYLLSIFERLRQLGFELGFILPEVPARLATDTESEVHRPASPFTAPEHIWAPYLLPLLDKFGQGVQHWQLGMPGDQFHPEDAPGAQALHQFLAKLVPGPVLCIPASADVDAQPPAGTGLIVNVPYAFDAAAVGELARTQHGPQTLVVQPLPSEFSPIDAAIDLTRKMVEYWAASSGIEAHQRHRLALVQPWMWSTHGSAMPTATLAAWRNGIDQLSGREVVGTFAAGPGVTCYTLSPTAGDRSGALAAWISGPTDAPELTMYLGDRPVWVTDLFGNRTQVLSGPMSESEPQSPTVHRISLSESPVFINDVDTELIRFLSSFAVSPSVLQMTPIEHRVDLQFTNPWPARVDGRITILEPGGFSTERGDRDRSWKIHPRNLTFSMGPGQQAQLPVGITFSGVEETGLKPMVIELELLAQQQYPPLRLSSMLELSAETLQLDLGYRFPQRNDLVIEAQVTNKSTEVSTFEVTVFVPGFPRAKANISDLEPGSVVLRRFSYPGAGNLRGLRITASVQNTATQARMTKSLTLD